jgi:histidyl-tRNA synthetase
VVLSAPRGPLLDSGRVSGKIQAPRGTFDVLGDDARARASLEDLARRILEPAGYERIETPAFEATELFARGIGASTDVVQKEMFAVGEGDLTLRPEGTAPVCRAYLEHGMHKRPQPVKLWYLSTFFRHEAPQAGRYRQFWQVGSEVIGSDDPAVDAESILLLADLLEAVGVRARLRVSSLGTPATRAEYRSELQGYLRKHAEQLSGDVRARIDLNPLRAFDSDHPGTQGVMQGAPKLLDRLTDEDAAHFADVRRMLDEVGVAYEVDPTLVRGLDYYTRTVFEFTSDDLGAQSGVGGGGRYDGLIEQIGGQPTPGMGWAAGVERMLLASPPVPTAAPPLDLFVAYAKPEKRAEAFRLAADARRAGHPARVELAGRSLKAQLKQADRAGARYVAILGDEGTSLKDMESGEQKTVEPDTVMHHIRTGAL